MRATPSLTSRIVPTSSTCSSSRYCSISLSRTLLISLARSCASVLDIISFLSYCLLSCRFQQFATHCNQTTPQRSIDHFVFVLHDDAAQDPAVHMNVRDHGSIKNLGQPPANFLVQLGARFMCDRHGYVHAALRLLDQRVVLPGDVAEQALPALVDYH